MLFTAIKPEYYTERIDLNRIFRYGASGVEAEFRELPYPFNLLARPIQDALLERGFLKPTEPQVEVIPRILKGENVLLSAPTGTGKTEAAVLPVLDLILRLPERRSGVYALYITPLRALNRDLLDRIGWWCGKVGVTVAVRHGDTDNRERMLQARSPPEMLITTPETLQAILTGRVMRRHLSSVRWVIVDEIHEFAEDKRGSQLSLALERLTLLTSIDFQRIGLSATIGSLEEVGKFLVGVGRSVSIVKVPVAKHMKLDVVYPQPQPEDYELADILYTRPEVASRLRILRKLIEEYESVLLFTNTRSIAEVLASRFRVWDNDIPVSIHHSSLSKPARIMAEIGLKKGNLKGLVCTSSLELGIDIGRVNLTVQYMSPRQVTRLIQRVGRSGHSLGRVSKGVIVTMDSDDTLEAIVIARRALREELEPVKIPYKPYDVLAHQIAGLLMYRRRWRFDEILQVFSRAYPYRDLSEDDLVKVLSYMHERYPRFAWVSFEDRVVAKPARGKSLYEYYFENLSMIPDEKQYLVYDEVNDTPVGILDEAFVAEYGEPGVKFICQGRPWMLTSIIGDRIYVKPVDDPTGAIPSWVGEEIPVPFEVASEVGRIRRKLEECFKKGLSIESSAKRIARSYPINPSILMESIKESWSQLAQGYPLPTDRRIVVERWSDYLIIHVHGGSLINRSLGRILGDIITDRYGVSVAIQQDPYRVIMHLPGGLVNLSEIISILISLPSDEVRSRGSEAAEKTGLFKRRLVHVARRFSAIREDVDFTDVSLSQIAESLKGTVIYEEALKETLEKDMDVDGLIEKVIEPIRKGLIDIVPIESQEPSPLAKIGMERIGRRTDIIPADKMKKILLESVKARLMNESRTLVCTECFKYVETKILKTLSDVKCPVCGSNRLVPLNLDEVEAYKLISKVKRQDKLHEELVRAGILVAAYGLPAIYALSAKGLSLDDVEAILEVEPKLTDRFFELVIEAEKRALAKRYW